MKLMLILGSDEILGLVSANIKPLGFEMIRYRYVLKAMDNLDEIDPACIIISARDFPRHWKVLAQFVRYERSREECPIVLLKGDNFSLEEASKAFLIGVSGIVSDELSRPREMDQLQSILERYMDIPDKRKSRRYRAEPWTRFGFCMANPAGKIIITTTVKTLSSTGISVEPENPALAANLTEGTEIPECSLRIGDDIISPICRLIRKQSDLSMEFIFMNKVEQIILDSYIESIPLEEARLNRR
jgi:hypothetical protein